MEAMIAVPRVRVCTIHATTLYVDEFSGELRHGAIGASPANTVLARDQSLSAAGRFAELMHRGAVSLQPILCLKDHSWSRSSVKALDSSAVPASFNVVPLGEGMVGLEASGRYLCAEPDGRVTLSRIKCGPWEQFRTVDEEAGIDELTKVRGMNTRALLPEPIATRYHLGCGPNLVPGYLNIDWAHDVEVDRIYHDFHDVKGAYYMKHDLSTGLPGRDNSIDVIYHCHFLEHLWYRDSMSLLRQARLRLKPGGRMRILVPDLELWINNYYCNRMEFFDAYRRQALGDDANLYKTKGAVFMGMLHNFGHHCGYDFETLSCLLTDVGFINIQRTSFRESSIVEIQTMEPNIPLRSLESLCVECEKPPATKTGE